MIHTKEPWRFVAGDNYRIEADGIPSKYPHRFKSDDLGQHVAIVGNRTADFGEANARRIVACVNACAGIPTEMLESVTGQDVPAFNLLMTTMEQRDELLTAAKRCIHMHKMQVAKCGPEYTLIDGAALESVVARCETHNGGIHRPPVGGPVE